MSATSSYLFLAASRSKNNHSIIFNVYSEINKERVVNEHMHSLRNSVFRNNVVLFNHFTVKPWCQFDIFESYLTSAVHCIKTGVCGTFGRDDV